MRKILQKIAWKTHKISWEINLFNLYLNGKDNRFGFEILNIKNGTKWSGSLFEITGSLPTVTHLGDFRLDFLFLYEIWNNWCFELKDRKIWNRNTKFNLWQRLNLYINEKLNEIR